MIRAKTRHRNKARKNVVNSRRLQKFRDTWLSESDFKSWLTRIPDNKFKAKCTLCTVTFTAELAVIRNHAKTRSHVLKSESVSKQRSIDTFVDKNKSTETSTNTSVKRAEIKLCGFMVDHNIPFRVANHLTDMLKDCFPDSKILKEVQLKSTKATAVVKNVLGESQKDILTKKLQTAKFSILIDESTDISAVKTMCIIVRFYDEEEGKVVSRFGSSVRSSKKLPTLKRPPLNICSTSSLCRLRNVACRSTMPSDLHPTDAVL